MSMAIIFILITAAAVALKGAKRSADRTRTMSALRQMLVAYNNYSGDNEGMLLPGYIEDTLLWTPRTPKMLDIKAKLPNGTVLERADSSSYVWRLAPYLDKAIDIYMADYRSTEIMDRYNTEFLNGIYGPNDGGGNGSLQIALTPSFGLNSAFLGGDSTHPPTALRHWQIVNGEVQVNPSSVAAVRVAQVKNPGKIVVFAPTQGVGKPALIDAPIPLGYCELRPPFLAVHPVTGAGAEPTKQWTIDEDPASPTFGMPKLHAGAFGDAGLPMDRLADVEWDGPVGRLRSDSRALTIPIGHLDGSVETETLERLSVDMSRWAPNAYRIDTEWK